MQRPVVQASDEDVLPELDASRHRPALIGVASRWIGRQEHAPSLGDRPVSIMLSLPQASRSPSTPQDHASPPTAAYRSDKGPYVSSAELGGVIKPRWFCLRSCPHFLSPRPARIPKLGKDGAGPDRVDSSAREQCRTSRRAHDPRRRPRVAFAVEARAPPEGRQCGPLGSFEQERTPVGLRQ